MMHAAMVYGAAQGHAVGNERVAKEISRLLVSQNPQQVRLGMIMAGRNPSVLASLRRADALLARSAAAQVQQRLVNSPQAYF